MFGHKRISSPPGIGRDSPSLRTLASPSTGRIVAVDAARGCAMVLVCISHVAEYLSATPGLHWFLMMVARVATPTFLLLSGFIIAHLLRTGANRHVSVMLIDRGFFLLIVAHALLGLWMLPELGVFHWAFARTGITDAIGVALLLAVLLRALGGHLRIVLGIVMCLIGWFVARTLAVESEWGRLFASILLDVRDPTMHVSTTLPLVPYLGVFLIGMGLNSVLGGELAAGNGSLMARRLLLLGGSAVAAVIAIIALWPLVRPYLDEAFGTQIAGLVRETINPSFKRPPSPAYLAFYGGAGLVLLSALFRGRPTWLIEPILRRASIIGRASLMCYVVQDWMFFLVPRVLGLERIISPWFWFAWLFVCLSLLYALALAWTRAGGNRFLTVGLRRLDRAIESASPRSSRPALP